MERLRLEKLREWKNSSRRKPLIIRGARQTGKTWLMLEFGRRFYKSVVYINLEKSSTLKGFFEGGFDTNRIITAFELESNLKINAEDTLIIIDEIQEVP